MMITKQNREDIQRDYVNCIIDNMDTQSMEELLYFYISKEKDLLDNKTLHEEICMYYPAILDN